MRQYSPDLIEATWLVGVVPLDLKEGLAKGTFIQPTRSAPTWTQRPNGVGGILRLFNPNRSGFLTVLIDLESKVHQQLITIGNLDVLTRSITGPLVVRDGNTREVATYAKAYIATIPDIPKGFSPGVVPWRFNFETFVQQPFGFNENVVGN